MSLDPTAITLTPLAIGGAGIVEVQLDSQVQAIVAFIGTVAATAYNDSNAELVQVSLPLPVFANPTHAHSPNGGSSQSSFWGAPKTSGIILTVFTQDTDGNWDDGVAVTGFDLTPSFSWEFPWDADWVVNRIQDVADTVQPLSGKTVRVTRAFPRDTHAWPAINVQVDALTPTATFIGDIEKGVDNGDYTTTMTKGRIYSLQLSIVGWCGTPEERSALGAWMGGALEVVLDASRAMGWEDPSVSFRESEDFETLGVPAFIVTANLTVTVVSSLQTVEKNTYRSTTTNTSPLH
jgi:hypothetical protein